MAPIDNLLCTQADLTQGVFMKAFLSHQSPKFILFVRQTTKVKPPASGLSPCCRTRCPVWFFLAPDKTWWQGLPRSAYWAVFFSVPKEGLHLVCRLALSYALKNIAYRHKMPGQVESYEITFRLRCELTPRHSRTLFY